MRRLLLVSVVLVISRFGFSQIHSFGDLENQIQFQTLEYSEIRLAADSLFTHWRQMHPNDTGWAPMQKKYARWDKWVRSRSHYTDLNGVRHQVSNLNLQQLPPFTFCNDGPEENPWQNIGPNPIYKQTLQDNGLIHCLAVNPLDTNEIYIGAGELGGIYKTTNHGQDWVNLTDKYFKPGLGIRSIEIDPSNSSHILAGAHTRIYGQITSSHGILKSTDGGNNWTFITNAYSDSTLTNNVFIENISVIRFHPKNPSIVFAAGNKIIWKSKDGGQTWYKVFENNVTSNSIFHDLEIVPGQSNQIIASTSVFGMGSLNRIAQVFSSIDTGKSFQEVTPVQAYRSVSCPTDTSVFEVGPYAISIDISRFDTNAVYLFFGNRECEYAYYFMKSSNAGANWQVLDSGFDITIKAERWGNWGAYRKEFEVSDGSDSIYFIGGDVVLKKNIFSGQFNNISQYTPTLTPPNSTHADVRGFVHLGLSQNGEDIMYMANDGGLSKTKNGGQVWIDLNGNGLVIAEFDGLGYLSNRNIYVGGAMHNYIQYKKSNGEWGSSVAGDCGWVRTHPLIPDRVFFVLNGDPFMKRYREQFNRIEMFMFSNLPDTNRHIFGGTSYRYAERKKKLGMKIETSRLEPNRIYFGGETYQYYDLNTLRWHKLFQRDSTSLAGGDISAFKVADSDKNRMYIAYDYPTWDNGPLYEHQFFRTDDGGQSWVNLTSNLYALKWYWITDLVIDPFNPDRLWVSMSEYRADGIWRVFYSGDAGATWQDISYGLPMFAVNCLAYQEGSNDIIYAGTDVGVYYWDIQDSSWHCFNKDLAPVIIKQLTIDHCNNELIAATYGRGGWKAPLLQNPRAFQLTQSQLWDVGETRYFWSKVIVDNNSTLTIKGDVLFGKDGNLDVKPGSKVIIDGGHISAINFCGDSVFYWQGVNLIGNANLSQNYQNQGVLEMINGGTISHARTAVSNVGWAGNDFAWGTQGGIVHAVNSNFINNRRDLQFISYRNHWYGSKEWDYISSFINCNFVRDSNYRMEEPYAAVTMWDVNGINFWGCKFENNPTNYANKGHGIFALSSQFLIDEKIGMNGTDPSTFKGYNYAIHASNVCRADRYTTIANTTFEDNRFGVYLNTHLNARVVKNTFNVPDLSSQGGENPPYGLYFDHSSGYAFAQNTFVGIGTTQPKLGVIMNESGADANQAYKNTFNNLLVASEAIGSNKGTSGNSGLQFRCNNYGATTPNTVDIGVWPALNPGNNNQGIAENQGYLDPFTPNPSDLANNLFSRYVQDILNSPGLYQFKYLHGTGDLRYAPMNPSNIVVIQAQLYVDYSSSCPDSIRGTGLTPTDDKGALRTGLAGEDGYLGGKRSLYTQLINGGNTPALEAQILFVNEDEHIDLYLDLIDISPYVDEGQLINLIGISDFPELALRNVLVANPHSGREPSVIEALYNRDPAVSQQTLDDVENGTQTITAKDLIEADMAMSQQRISGYLRDLQYYFITDSTYWDTDSLQSFFATRTEADYVFMLAEYYYQKGNNTAIINILENADKTWWTEAQNLTSTDLLEFYNIVGNLEEGENLAKLSTSTRGSLEGLQGQTSSTWLYQRINSLLLPFGEGDLAYVEPVFLPSEQKTSIINKQRPRKPATSFNLFPNPARQFTQLSWDWFVEGMNTAFEIRIVNLHGQIVSRINVEDCKTNIKLIHTDNLVSGMYLIEVISKSNQLLFNTKLIIQ